MKKLLTILLAALLILSAVACAEKEAEKPAPAATAAPAVTAAPTAAPIDSAADPVQFDEEGLLDEGGEAVFYTIPEIPLEDSPFKVLADVFAVLNQTDDEGNTPSYGASMSDALYVAAFEKDGACYRVEGAIPPEMAVQLNAIDFFDEERDDKQQVLLSPLPVTRVGDLSACRLSQAELDALVGKTGQEIMDDGWTFQSYFMTGGDETAATYAKDYYAVNLTFDANISSDKADKDVNGDEMKAAKVSAAENAGVSDAAVDPTLLGKLV